MGKSLGSGSLYRACNRASQTQHIFGLWVTRYGSMNEDLNARRVASRNARAILGKLS